MAKERKRKYIPRHITPGQKLALVFLLMIVFGICSTIFLDLRTAEEADAILDSSGWENVVNAFILAPEGDMTVPFYNEGLAEIGQYGRGSVIELESWEPFVTEDGEEYYHAYMDGRLGYISVDNVTDDLSELMQETQVYVRTPANLLTETDGFAVGPLAEKGSPLRIVGYDFFNSDGTVNMYHVKLGEEFGWIPSEYVVGDYAASMENWSSTGNSYRLHQQRGDTYGGGNAADLDYWPHVKGDFADEGNVMPEDVYSLLIQAYECDTETIQRYIDLAEGTAINAFVVSLYDEGEFAYASPWIKSYNIPNYAYDTTVEEFAQSMQMLKDAGYYIIGRIAVFRDPPLAQAHPEWSITNVYGSPMELNGSYWPSAFCRDVWELKVGLAVEAADTFGFNEIQFDYVRFPDYIVNYEQDGSVDLKNTYNESKAQTVQRFLTYATDVLHEHGVYVGADVFGETSNTYVAPYGQYWAALSNVVDVICGMPYPDHFSSYFDGSPYYKHPYRVLYEWGNRVYQRQHECASPAIVRTWLQTWDDYGYRYDALAIQRQIVALYDVDITGGYMLWHGMGSLYVAEDLPGAIDYDYLALYKEAEEQDMLLSKYMKMDTGEDNM